MVRQTLKAAASYFGLVFGAGFLLGCIRVPFVVPQLGTRAAELLEMPIELVVIFYAARFVVTRFELGTDGPVRLAVGLVALALVVAAELLLAAALAAGAVGPYLASRDPVSGSVYLLVLLVFALLPKMMGHPDSRA